ncbi:MAG: hypothetical protein QM536_03190 [Chitinophagaceae bacterium]|nr:hypothetical protein [Chitinophagaceae bacterium]
MKRAQKTKKNNHNPLALTQEKIRGENISYNYCFLAITVIGLFLYGQTFFFDYVYLDDTTAIHDGKAYFEVFSHIWEGFIRSAWLDYYRPVLFGSIILNYTMGGQDPFIYHFFNVFFHIFSCCLLFWFLVLLKYERIYALLTTLLFVVHPLFSQAVSWIFGRNDPLLSIAMLSSFIFLLHYIEYKKKYWYLLHLVFFFLALCTKETGIGIPLVYAAYIVFVTKNKKFLFTGYKPSPLLIGWILVVIFWYFLRTHALNTLSGNRTLNSTFGIDALLYNIPTISEFLAKFFVPIQLSVFASFSQGMTLLGIFLYLFLGILCYIKIVSREFFLWVSIWWFVFLIPPLLILYDADKLSDYLEHRAYLPAISLILLLNEMLKNIKNKKIPPLLPISVDTIFKYALVSIISLFFIITFLHTQNFKNVYTFWTNATETSPQHPGSWKALGKPYYESGNRDKAQEYFLKSFERNPKDWEICYSLGFLFEKKQKYDSALFFYKYATLADEKRWEAFVNIGVLYFYQKKYDEAEKYWKHTITLSDNESAYINLVSLAIQKNNLTEAKYYLELLKSKGKDVSASFPQLHE